MELYKQFLKKEVIVLLHQGAMPAEGDGGGSCELHGTLAAIDDDGQVEIQAEDTTHIINATWIVDMLHESS